MHVKVRVDDAEVHTGQLSFPDATSRAVHAQAAYGSRGAADTENGQDGLYAQGGDASVLRLARAGDGYVGRLTMGVRLD